MAKKVDHTHGDNGIKPADSLNFQRGDKPDPETFDWFWSEVPAAINDHADELDAIDADDDGTVDSADTAAKVKGNDIDSDGDGKVDAADSAESADSANTLSGSLESISNINKLASGSVSVSSNSTATVVENYSLTKNDSTIIHTVRAEVSEGGNAGRVSIHGLTVTPDSVTQEGEIGVQIDPFAGDVSVRVINDDNDYTHEIHYKIYEIV